jgi:hypothetical protein
MACQQRHCGDQDQLSHDTLRYLVNPSYLNWPLSRRAAGPDFDQGGSAGEAIDQAEQMTPHDRTPLLIIADNLHGQAFRRFSRALENGFVGSGQMSSEQSRRSHLTGR